jgi:aerobic carbon-monoxide dehydrogenase small subunit
MEDTAKTISFTINGMEKTVQVQRSWTLLYLIREILGLTGTKYGCGTGDCGACKILLNGEPKNSCTLPALKADTCTIITIEGIQENGRLSILQQAFVDAGAIQCGFCTPGMIITGTALLRDNADPTELEIRDAYANNLCRCTGYVKIVEAVQLASKRILAIKKDREVLLEAINDK